jgi:hypothetical protein
MKKALFLILAFLLFAEPAKAQTKIRIDDDATTPDFKVLIGKDVSYPDIKIRIGEDIENRFRCWHYKGENKGRSGHK